MHRTPREYRGNLSGDASPALPRIPLLLPFIPQRYSQHVWGRGQPGCWFQDVRFSLELRRQLERVLRRVRPRPEPEEAQLLIADFEQAARTAIVIRNSPDAPDAGPLLDALATASKGYRRALQAVAAAGLLEVPLLARGYPRDFEARVRDADILASRAGAPAPTPAQRRSPAERRHARGAMVCERGRCRAAGPRRGAVHVPGRHFCRPASRALGTRHRSSLCSPGGHGGRVPGSVHSKNVLAAETHRRSVCIAGASPGASLSERSLSAGRQPIDPAQLLLQPMSAFFTHRFFGGAGIIRSVARRVPWRALSRTWSGANLYPPYPRSTCCGARAAGGGAASYALPGICVLAPPVTLARAQWAFRSAPARSNPRRSCRRPVRCGPCCGRRTPSGLSGGEPGPDGNLAAHPARALLTTSWCGWPSSGPAPSWATWSIPISTYQSRPGARADELRPSEPGADPGAHVDGAAVPGAALEDGQGQGGVHGDGAKELCQAFGFKRGDARMREVEGKLRGGYLIGTLSDPGRCISFLALEALPARSGRADGRLWLAAFRGGRALREFLRCARRGPGGLGQLCQNSRLFN